MQNHIRNAIEIDLTTGAPPTAVSVKLQVNLPKGGAALIYSAPTFTDPARCNAPSTMVDVAYGEGKAYLQLIDGAQEYDVRCAGYVGS